ncbi:hypothetical protein GOODEAATRI_024983 [Goodea atripinnis]|uniref:Prolactin receptor n=1 Tax=Goodea atripinnis TaxID=208336 RepID=A0ABV0MUX2_9TELE
MYVCMYLTIYTLYILSMCGSLQLRSTAEDHASEGLADASGSHTSKGPADASGFHASEGPTSISGSHASEGLPGVLARVENDQPPAPGPICLLSDEGFEDEPLRVPELVESTPKLWPEVKLHPGSKIHGQPPDRVCRGAPGCLAGLQDYADGL